MNINVLIAHRTPLIQAGLVALLEAQAGVSIVPSGADVAVTDFDGLMASGWSCPVVLVMPRAGERELRAAAQNGACGYVTQDCAAEELLAALQALAAGRCYFGGAAGRTLADLLQPCRLTGREQDVLRLLAEGISNKEIARHLNIGLGTVKSHLKSLMQKLEVSSRTQAVVVAVQRGMVPTSPREGRSTR